MVKLRVAAKALGELTERVRQITSRNGWRSLQQVAGEQRNYLLGWRQYFCLAETPRIFEDLDQWIHRRLRMLQLRQWKCGPTLYRELKRRGVDGAALWIAALTSTL